MDLYWILFFIGLGILIFCIWYFTTYKEGFQTTPIMHITDRFRYFAYSDVIRTARDNFDINNISNGLAVNAPLSVHVVRYSLQQVYLRYYTSLYKNSSELLKTVEFQQPTGPEILKSIYTMIHYNEVMDISASITNIIRSNNIQTTFSSIKDNIDNEITANIIVGNSDLFIRPSYLGGELNKVEENASTKLKNMCILRDCLKSIVDGVKEFNTLSTTKFPSSIMNNFMKYRDNTPIGAIAIKKLFRGFVIIAKAYKSGLRASKSTGVSYPYIDIDYIMNDSDSYLSDIDKLYETQIREMKLIILRLEPGSTNGIKTGSSGFTFTAEDSQKLTSASRMASSGFSAYLSSLENERDTWKDMLRNNTLTFLVTMVDTVYPTKIDPNIVASLPNHEYLQDYRSWRQTLTPSSAPSINTLIRNPEYTRQMQIVGTISSDVLISIERSARLTQYLMLSEPGSLEKYIYISPTTFKAYIRTGLPTDVSPAAIKASLQDVVNAFKIASKGTTVTPFLIGDIIIDKPGNEGEIQILSVRHNILTDSTKKAIYRGFINEYDNYTDKNDKSYTPLFRTQLYNDMTNITWKQNQLGIPIFTEKTDGDGNVTYPLNAKAILLNNLFFTQEITPDILALLPLPASDFVSQYLQRRIPVIQKNMHVPVGATKITATSHFNLNAPNIKSTLDYVAQWFYDNDDGSVAMTYIYDVYPISNSILDIRYDIAYHKGPAVIQDKINALRALYQSQIAQNISQQEYNKLTESFQISYESLVSAQDSSLNPSETTVSRFFYEVSGNSIKITGAAIYDIAAGSFYSQYNCGFRLDVSSNSLGNVNYPPITLYKQNVVRPFSCTDMSDMQMVIRDYTNGLLGDLPSAPTNPWSKNGNLVITKVLGVQQTGVAWDIHWVESEYDATSNKPGELVERKFQVKYNPNFTQWYANENIFDPSGFKYHPSSYPIPPLATPMVPPSYYIGNTTLDDGGEICPKAYCSDVLYSLVDQYNSDPTTPGIILKVHKITTMNSQQCDLLADIDYTSSKGAPSTAKAGNVLRDLITLYVQLDIASCDYIIGESATGYGIQDNTPNMSPFDYVKDFVRNSYGSINSAAQTVVKQIGSALVTAQSTITDYRLSTYANMGDIQTFEGCPNLRCGNVTIMNRVFQYYADNNEGERMGIIHKIGASPHYPNSCDVIFTKQTIDIDKNGKYVGVKPQTSAARFFFTPAKSAYDAIIDARIAANPALRDALLEEKKGLRSTCRFDVASSKSIMPVNVYGVEEGITNSIPYKWGVISDISNQTISPINAKYINNTNYTNPYRIYNNGVLKPAGTDPKCQDILLKDVSGIIVYWGYDSSYETAKVVDNIYETRVTTNEKLPLGDTYYLFDMYTDDQCNPVIKNMRSSTFDKSVLSYKVQSHLDADKIRMLHTYFIDNLPDHILGEVVQSGYNYTKNNTGLVYYGAKMIKYDANKSVLAYYPDPYAYMAVEFRERFIGKALYVANVYFIDKPADIEMNIAADPTPKRIPDPYVSITEYNYIKFTPLSVRGGTKASMTRLEFYSGTSIITPINPVLSVLNTAKSLEIVDPSGIIQTSKNGFDSLYRTNGLTMIPSEENNIVCDISSEIILYSESVMQVDGLSFITGNNAAQDITGWSVAGSVNGTFWKPLYRTTSSYSPYGHWHIPLTSFNGTSTPLAQNPNRLKGFLECGESLSEAFIQQLSNSIYTSFSQQYFIGSEMFDAAEKNVKRAYLTGIRGWYLDDINDTIYIKPTVQILRKNYQLMDYSSLTSIVKYKRTKNCSFNYTITHSTAESKPFTPLTIPTMTAPFAWGGYPAAINKYTQILNKKFYGTPVDNLYTVARFMSNGPDRPTMIQVSPMTSYTNMTPEGAAQMCADNVDCIGFNSLDLTGTFFTDPTINTKLVTSTDNTQFYFKKGLLLTQYVRVIGLQSGSKISLSKLAFYKGSTLIQTTPNTVYSINADGKISSIVDTQPIKNLFNYTVSNYWKSDAVYGIYIGFSSPIIFDGYTLVTSPETGHDPTNWSIEVSNYMDGPWTTVDTKNVVPPVARVSAYPLFKLNGTTGVSTDFIPKKLTTCNDPQLIQTMIDIYRSQNGIKSVDPATNPFNMVAIGLDNVTNQCVVSYNSFSDLAIKNTAFEFNPVFGNYSAMTKPENISIKVPQNPGVVASFPYEDTPSKYARFIPLSGSGAPVSLTGIFLLSKGAIVKATAVNPLATAGNTSAAFAVNESLSTQWSDTGYLLLTYSPTVVDSFTMYSGQTSGSPTRWRLELSADGILWQLAHSQNTDITPPGPKQQYPIYSFTSSVTTNTNILQKNLTFAGQSCSDSDIMGKVNDAAFAQTPPIFFNPTSQSYNAETNTCDYKQGNDTVLRATFTTSIYKNTEVSSVQILPAAQWAGGTAVRGPMLEASINPQTSCTDDTILSALSSFYSQTNINTTKAPLSVIGGGLKQNECIFELDSMYKSPLDSDKLGFQFKPRMASNPLRISDTTTKLNANPDTDFTLTKMPEADSYKYIRFKVKTTTGAKAPIKINNFEFFKMGSVTPIDVSPVITNPLGTGCPNSDRCQFPLTDSNRKPIQFSFKEPFAFDGYSWTSSREAVVGMTRSDSDPTSWELQGSSNGILWTSIHTATTPITLREIDAGFKMPIFWIDGGTEIRDRQIAEVSRNTLDVCKKTCDDGWPAAQAAYNSWVIEQGGEQVSTTPIKSFYTKSLNQCAYEFKDDNYGNVILGARFVDTCTPTIDTTQNDTKSSGNQLINGLVINQIDPTATNLPFR